MHLQLHAQTNSRRRETSTRASATFLTGKQTSRVMTSLNKLHVESIHLIRDVRACSRRPKAHESLGNLIITLFYLEKATPVDFCHVQHLFEDRKFEIKSCRLENIPLWAQSVVVLPRLITLTIVCDTIILAHTADIVLATKWLRIFSISLNDKIRNHLVANRLDE